MSQRKKAGSYPSPDQMEKMMELYERYSDATVPEDKRPTQQQLSDESGIAQTTLGFWFRKFAAQETGDEEDDARAFSKGGPRGKLKDRAQIVAERRTTREAIKSIGKRSASDYEQAINIGDLVVGKYGDLVKISLATGAKLEDFVADVFNWYESREEMLRQLHELQTELAELRELTDPNYRFKRKSQVILDFAMTCAQLNKTGGHINVRQAARALQNDLDKIDQDIEMKNQKTEMTQNG